MKPNSIHPRELLAWVVLTFALALFSVTVLYAQEKEKGDKSEIRIKIQKDENGKKTKIDTTITADQLPAFKDYLKDQDIDFDAGAEGWGFSKGKGPGTMKMQLSHPGMTDQERAAFELDMERLKEDMDELGQEMKDLHIEMYGFDDGKHENFDFHMRVPPSPHAIAPIPYPGDFFSFDDEDSDWTCKPGQKFRFRMHSMSDEIPDSLNDDRHIVLYGAKGEETPILEKEIVTKDGNKIFVFRRKLPSAEKTGADASMSITNVKAYPNPGNGKITVRFKAGTSGDIRLSISDTKGNEIYTKDLQDFSGEYVEQIDLSGKGKGTYFLKIIQGDDSITKKLVVE